MYGTENRLLTDLHKVQGCLKKHYWTCTGSGTATHKAQKVFQGKTCESQLSEPRDDGVVQACGLKLKA